jgi:hypothetical protein
MRAARRSPSPCSRPAGQAQPYPQAEAQALALAQETIAHSLGARAGNRTADVAQVLARALTEAGWAQSDIDIVPVDDTAYLIATWPGSDPSLGPIVLSAHMDVVEARPEDWERDPFTPVVENGYLYGRGASDTKFEAALAVASLIEMRRRGFRPKRSIVVAYSGDEETTMKTSQLIAERLRNAEVVLNIDGSSGTLSEETGRPLYWSWQGAEKTYMDFKLEVTNPGGHSSAPRADNAIAQLSRALARISAYRFTPEINDITRGLFRAGRGDPSRPADRRRDARLRRRPDRREGDRRAARRPSMIGRSAPPACRRWSAAATRSTRCRSARRRNVNCRVFPAIRAPRSRPSSSVSPTRPRSRLPTRPATPRPTPTRRRSGRIRRRVREGRQGRRGAMCRSTRHSRRARRIRCGTARSACRATAPARASSRIRTTSRTGSTSAFRS